MTEAVVKKKKGLYDSLEVKGHTGFSTSGSDIVCAGISTAVIMSVNLLDKLIPNLFEVIQNEAEGYICLKNIQYSRIQDVQKEFIQFIFENLIETFESIQANYQNHFKVKIEK